MAIKIPKFDFNSTAFSHTFIERKARRGIDTFLNGIGLENIKYAVENGVKLMDMLPPEVLQKYSQTSIPHDIAEKFPDDEIYHWIPPTWRAYFENLTGGKEWVMSQLSFLRRFLVNSS